MKLSLDDHLSSYLIRSYGPGEVVINEERITASVIVLPERLLRDWEPQSFEQLRPQHLDPILEIEPEVLILGTGAASLFPDPEILRETYSRRIGTEVMDTAAACRTFNILASEGRRVAAALMMI